MRLKAILPLAALAFALVGPGFTQQQPPAQAGQTPPGALTLSLEDCVVRALKDNLGVAIQVLGPQLSAEALNQAQEKFFPTLSMSASSTSSQNASYSYLDAATSLIDKTQNYGFLSARQSLPTGGTLNLGFTGYRTTTNRTGQTINPRYGTTLSFTLTQPLLRNFGFQTTRRDILVASNNLGVSDETLKSTLMTTVYNVESAYWNLVYSIANLDVRQQSLKLAQDLLEKNQRSVEIGTLAPMEILSAQAEVATREADLIQAETQIKSNEDQLKLLLNITGEEDKTVTALVPKDKPSYTLREVSLEEAVAAAIQNRSELKIAQFGLNTDHLNLSYAKNQVLPDLNLSASLSSPGIDGTRLIYSDNDPIFGTLIGTVPGGIGGALKQTAKFQYPNWNLGLTLNVPLANIFSRAALAQAKLNLRQDMLDLENQKDQIYVEVKNNVRAVESNYKRIIAYTKARELAEQKLAAEEEKLRVGMSTNYMVLSYQRDLATARISELNAIVSYQVSVAALERSEGTNLQTMNIKLSDYVSGLK